MSKRQFVTDWLLEYGTGGWRRHSNAPQISRWMMLLDKCDRMSWSKPRYSGSVTPLGKQPMSWTKYGSLEVTGSIGVVAVVSTRHSIVTHTERVVVLELVTAEHCVETADSSSMGTMCVLPIMYHVQHAANEATIEDVVVLSTCT